MKLYNFSILIISLFIFIGCKSEINEKPNIIWLISEDNSPFLGCYGDSFATTPNLDKFAEKSVKFLNAFSNAPVCAPSRSTLITGMYATSLGTHNMRSENPTPEFLRFFPYYLKKAGYFTSNRVKKDYNTIDQDSVWDITDWWGWAEALTGRKKDQPFFMMYNTWISHEGKIHPNSDNWGYFKGTMSEHGVDSSLYKKWWDNANHEPEEVNIPPYHPETEIMRRDWAKYYDCVELMDREMGVVLQKIEEDGLLENTIIFYFSDHGGVLGRSKRFIFDSGLKVPMLLYVPDKFRNLVNYKMGTETDKVVSFIDLAPTVLNLAGLEIPDYMMGTSFTGEFEERGNELAFGFRGRMDERYDKARTLRSKNFRYVKNFMPHRIYGGKINYLWKAESMLSWKDQYEKGNLNEKQSAFWNTKPSEELYYIKTDPHNVNNLADDPEYSNILIQMREDLKAKMIQTKDLGVFPEAEMVRRYGNSNPYDMIRENNFPFEIVLQTANIATDLSSQNIKILSERLDHNEPVVRYWATLGFAIHADQAEKYKVKINNLLDDESPSVQIAAAEVMYLIGSKEKSIETLYNILSLPKFGKNDKLGNTELYSNHFAVTEALNVIDALHINSSKLNKLIKEIADSERAGKKDYDKRIAMSIVKKYNL